ncbi:MAG TPA: RHS repeat-associated core domain-containing protein, partial [Verrucomicrobiae bacterium]
VFIYDGLGRLRIRREYQGPPTGRPFGPTVPTTSLPLVSETRYIYDGLRVIQERDSNNVPLVSYTRGVDLSGTLESAGGIGGLLARSSGYSSGNWTNHNYYHPDGNGNITYLVNSSQGLAASYRYDPFGNTISSSGTLAAANVYRFSSKEIHINSGMYYYLYRFYDPTLQRWINRDPVDEPGFNLARRNRATISLGEPNMYLFVSNDPVSNSDLFGLRLIDPGPPHLPSGTYFDIVIAPGGGSYSCFICVVFGISKSKTPNAASLKFCLGVAKARYRSMAAAGNAAGADAACQLIDDCYKKWY